MSVRQFNFPVAAMLTPEAPFAVVDGEDLKLIEMLHEMRRLRVQEVNLRKERDRLRNLASTFASEAQNRSDEVEELRMKYRELIHMIEVEEEQKARQT